MELDPTKPQPTFQPIYKLSDEQHEILRDYVESALRKKWIRPSTSPMGAAVFFVEKVNGGKRLCVDYRRLNEATIKNRYPLPLFDNLVERLRSAK